VQAAFDQQRPKIEYEDEFEFEFEYDSGGPGNALRAIRDSMLQFCAGWESRYGSRMILQIETRGFSANIAQIKMA
jgi:hypothetical protein